MVDWSGYLESICTDYAQWWEVYTLTEVVGKQQQKPEKIPLLFDFGLMVQTVEQEQEQRDSKEREEKEHIERLGVLEGLRKYAAEHVLLVGRPGSGKSTALARLLLEEAQRRRAGENGGEIPVLVELSYYPTSILDLIQDFLQRHQPKLEVDGSTLKNWLRQGQLLLLVDGVNELPSQQARQDLHTFRQNYQKTTPMVFTTRDLGVGGDLDITKKLEMQPLSEGQMQQFVRKYLPEQGEQMLKQLGSRLREFGQTPLLLMMLCSVFTQNRNRVPVNLGSVFRQFTQIYNRKLKQDIPISQESRRWWQPMLQQLAWVMTCGEGKTQLQVAIPRQQAEAVLMEFLQGKVANPEDCALCWLDDLLNHHLIQLRAGEQIEFRHQLLQEYYTAEYLLKLLTSSYTSPSHISDEELKREYLNYLKWTEPLALMLELLDNEAQAVRVVKLALEVDWRLGARLAGAVKPKFQEQTVGLVAGLEIPQLFKIQLLGITSSESAFPSVLQALTDEEDYVRRSAAEALGKIGTESTIPTLIQVLQDQDYFVNSIAVEVLYKIGTEAAIPTLIQALQHKDYSVRSSAAEALGKICTESTIPILTQALQDEDYFVRSSAAEVLGKIGTESTIPTLIQALQDEDYFVRSSAAIALGKIGAKVAIPTLIQALQDEDYSVRRNAAVALGKIGTEASIPALIQALQDEDYSVRRNAAVALGKIGTEASIPALITALQDEDYSVRRNAAVALGEIGTETAIPALITALQDQNYSVRSRAAEVLGKIGTKAATPAFIQALQNEDDEVRNIAAEVLGKINTESATIPFIQALQDEDYSVRRNAVEALRKIGAEATIPALITALQDQDYSVRSRAAKALGEIGTEVAVPALITALQDQDDSVCRNAVDALSKIGTRAATPALIQALQAQDSYLRRRAAETLGKIGTGTAIPALIQALQDEDNYLRKIAAEVLGKIGTEAAIPALITALQDEDDYVRQNAAVALGKIGTEVVISALIKALQDQNYSVRKNAAVALGKIGTEVVISVLIKALQDRSSSVRSSAAESLGKIGTESAIHQLVKALKQENFVTANQGDTLDFAINALEQIQECYQLYNPTLTQPIPTPEPLPHIPSTQLMYILHLSDLHITTPNQATLWSNQLAEDLRNELDIPHLDALILSGDIANYSTPEEYQAAEQFLHNLRQDFPLEPEQIIIVPGNHDLNWKQAKKAYNLVDREEYEGKLQEGHYIEESSTVIRVRDEEAYQQRFVHFSQFYQAIANQPYPLDYDQQSILYHLREQNLLILGLNSAWELDHHYKSRASINMNALSNALTQIRRNRVYDNCLKIAVWHHPLISAYEDRITDAAFLEQLAVAGFRFFLHGHIHEAKTSNYRYDMSQDGRKLDQICAGTFGAPTQELVTGTPWQYNLLQFEPDKLTVRTRRRTKENGAWEADSIWRQGKGTSSVDYYRIDLDTFELS